MHLPPPSGLLQSDSERALFGQIFGSHYSPYGTYVPYTGASNDVNLGAYDFTTTGDVTSGTVSAGTSPAQTGSVRIPNGTGNGIYARDGAGTGDRQVLYVSSGNIIILAGGTQVTGKLGVDTALSTTTELNLPASTTGVSSLRIAHGAAPSSPVNGDMWTTTAGLFVRINGSTVGPLA